MKTLYVTSIERYSGKTATCLALGKCFMSDGYKIGYLKPLSLQPWRLGNTIVDEDANFVKDIFGLDEEPQELSPVVITPEFLRAYLSGDIKQDLMQVVQSTFEKIAKGRDILLLEGGASLREGYTVGLATPAVARALSSHVLVVIKYSSNIRLIDDALSAKTRLGKPLIGAILNRVPEEARDFVETLAKPFLEKNGVAVLGIIPEVPRLAAITIGELIGVLDAKVLTEKIDTNALVETLTVGAMTAEAALRRFREQTNKAVITGGDRTDIQLAALETSTTCLILTGNLHPSPLIIKQAEEFGVAILLVSSNTMETIEAIEKVFGKTRLAQPAKLAQFQELLMNHLDKERLYRLVTLK